MEAEERIIEEFRKRWPAWFGAAFANETMREVILEDMKQVIVDNLFEPWGEE